MTAPERITPPETLGGAYTDDDRRRLTEIYIWLARVPERNTRAQLARLSGVPNGTLSTVLAGTYPSSPSRQLTACVDAIRREAERTSVPYVETATAKLVWQACHRARVYRNVSCITGAVGVGKTRALKEYCDRHAGSYLLEADPDEKPRELLTDLLVALNVSAGQSATEMLRAAIDRLRGADAVVIVDEAEKLIPKALEYLRRLRDKAGVGIVLVGTEKLSELLSRQAGQFDQVRSRTGFWPDHVSAIDRADAEALVRAAFDPPHQVDEAVIEACWQVCRGSMRVLAEQLVPGVRDFGLAQGHPLSAALIRSTAQQVLGLRGPSASR